MRFRNSEPTTIPAERWTRFHASLSEETRKKGRRIAPYHEVRYETRRVLGQYGYYPDDTYVWAVVDQASDFTVGGVPEPSTLVLLLGGGGALLVLLTGCRIRK